jgi:hypothetical protein
MFDVITHPPFSFAAASLAAARMWDCLWLSPLNASRMNREANNASAMRPEAIKTADTVRQKSVRSSFMRSLRFKPELGKSVLGYCIAIVIDIDCGFSRQYQENNAS